MGAAMVNEYARWSGVRQYLPEITVLLLINAAVIGAVLVNPFALGLDFWAVKAAEIASFHIPGSNFYPIGPALLCLPFFLVGLGSLGALFFYLNAGVVLYALICRRIEDRLIARIALFSILLNPYFFWLVVSSHDCVLQFFTLSLAFYLLIEARPVLFALAGILAATVRSTDLFVFGGLAILMFAMWRKSIWLLSPALYLFVAFGNLALYDSPSPSTNGGYNIFLGQHPLFAVAYPSYDIDQFFETKGLSSPEHLFGMHRTPQTEAELDTRYREMGFSFAKDDPVRAAQNALSKAALWLFNFQKVPEVSGKIYLEEGGHSIAIESLRGGKLLLGQMAYTLYKFVYNILFAVTIFYVCLRPSDFLSERHFFLILPVFFVLPVVLLSFPDTRFKIVYEVMAVPAILLFAFRAAAQIVNRESANRE
ncbi:hypothetical protein [Parvibaculum sp.]|uniref:hypothetical protein n=1 Tax=Parvibaculum sp. TaxID=2024848 RepID=UPI000C92C199|nr:hypothetical protein [Parvibaculum sp.]MAB15394.1 hypothetical protein [Parvibaculum sp.]